MITEKLTVTEAVPRIRNRELSPVEWVHSCFHVIDNWESEVSAWAYLDRDAALRQARILESEADRGSFRSHLHGIPVGVKDIIDVSGMPTRAGSTFYERIPEEDASIVARLRANGAIILGKTVTAPFAGFDHPATRNPLNLAHTPGGSSSGSAAAVACGMCPAAIGTQTGGSLSRPAAYCGLAACKPTIGRASVQGIIPFAFSLDQPGPMAKCVHDLRLLLLVMAGYDSRDPHSSNSPFVDLLEPGPLGAVNIGVIRGDFVGRSQADVVHAFELACSAFDAAGATLCEIELPHSLDDILKHHEVILAAEATVWHRSLFEKFSAQYPPKLAKLIKEARLLPASTYAEARAFQLRFRSEIEDLLKTKCDVLLTPSAPSTAPVGHQSTGNPAFNAPWSFSGHPTVVFPAGLGHNGLPTSIQLIGPFMREHLLLTVAEWCEAALQRT